MIDKEKLARLVVLKKTLDDTEDEINRLLGGEALPAPAPEKAKAIKKCSICNEPGHRADGCPSKPRVEVVEAPVETTTELPQPHL